MLKLLQRQRLSPLNAILYEKITIEGLFTIVMKAIKRDKKYLFTTQNDSYDTVKTPMGMFDAETIDNDLSYVTQTIKSYYGE